MNTIINHNFDFWNYPDEKNKYARTPEYWRNFTCFSNYRTIYFTRSDWIIGYYYYSSREHYFFVVFPYWANPKTVNDRSGSRFNIHSDQIYSAARFYFFSAIIGFILLCHRPLYTFRFACGRFITCIYNYVWWKYCPFFKNPHIHKLFIDYKYPGTQPMDPVEKHPDR